MTETKTCTICLEEKPLIAYYHQDKKKASGEKYVYIVPYCKKCASRKSLESNYDRELKKEGSRLWKQRAENKESVSNSHRKYRESGKYNEWQDNNKDRLVAYRMYREMHKKHEISTSEWKDCKNYFDSECAYCGLHISEHFIRYAGELKWTDFHKEHVDHKGDNDLSNCVPSCKSCNSRKHSFEFSEWYCKDNPVFSLERKDKINRWLSQDYFMYLGE